MIPPAKPVAWDVGCISCDQIAGTTPMDELDSSWWSNDKRAAMVCSNRTCEEFGELAFDVYGRDQGARWGEQWAVVAWLAAAEFEGWFSLVSEGIPATRESWREHVSETATGQRLIDWGKT